MGAMRVVATVVVSAGGSWVAQVTTVVPLGERGESGVV